MDFLVASSGHGADWRVRVGGPSFLGVRKKDLL